MSYYCWAKKLAAKLAHEKLVIEEAKKVKKHKGHPVRIKIGRKYKKLFEQYAGVKL